MFNSLKIKMVYYSIFTKKTILLHRGNYLPPQIHLMSAMKNAIKLIALILFISVGSCSRPAKEGDASSAPVRADNISNQFVYTIAEDSSGQIWIGTFRGLNRYNSRDYFQYYSSEDSLSLSDNHIRSLLKTRSGEFYVGTVQGMDRRTDRDQFESIDIGGRYLVGSMVEMADSTIMIEANYKLLAYKPGEKQARRLLDDICPGRQFLVRMHVDDRNNLWIVGDNAVRLYDFKTNSLTDSIPSPTICQNSFMVNGSEIWLAGDRISIIDTHTRKFKPLPTHILEHPVLGKARLELVHPYRDNGLLLLTKDNGMFLYDRNSGSILNQHDTGFPINVPDFKIKTMFTDSRQNIWFGGHDQGIAVHYHYTERFNHNKFIRSELENKSVVSVTADRDNNLWMATRNDGIFVYDNKDAAIKQIPMSSLTVGRQAYDDLVKCVFADSQGNIWLNLTNSQTLRCHYDGNSLVIDKRYPIWASMSIIEDPNGTIWIGTGSPYVHYLRKGATDFTPLQVFEPGFVFITGMQMLDENTIVAAAFDRDVMTIDINTAEISPLPLSDSSFKKTLRRALFIPTDLYRDRKDNLWIGTIANGLLKYNITDSTFTTVDGTEGKDISAIREDSDGCLWISTLNGMSRYCPENGCFDHFFAGDGIGGNQFYDRSATTDSAGNIYFGGTHGITSFNPKEVTSHVSAPLIFQNLIVHNKPVIPGTGIIDKNLEFAPDIRLDHERNSFGISFVAVDYCASPRITYRYMMEGIDKGWIEAQGSREAYYANVAPGSYTFKVGIMGDEKSVISIRVTVDGPWWTSWWAIIAYCIVFGCVVGVLLIAVMKIRKEREAVRRAHLEKEREQHINDMNMRFFANVSHEFRPPLTMISGPIKQISDSGNLGKEERHLLSIANVNVNRMLNLVNQLLDFNKLENDTLPLEVERIDIAALLRQMTDMFSTHAVGKEITFVTNGLEDNCFVTADADKLSKIMTNLMSNALKFTPRGGTITIGLDTVTDPVVGEAIKIYVRNTGMRIPSDKLETIFERYYQLDGNGSPGAYNCGSGIGLYYSRALTNIHHGRIFAVDNPDFEGAEFNLILPVSPEAYSDARRKGTPSQFDAYPLSSPPGAVSPTGADTGDRSGQPLVLIVDDDIQVAEYLRTLLSGSYRVVSRFDAESAMEWLDQNTPSLIISDVVMPGKDGYDLCRHVKHDIRFSHIPVILLTAKATVENQTEGLEADADAYVTKPFDPSLLLSQIGSLLRNRDKARQMITSGTTLNDIEADILSPQDNAFLQELYALLEKELANCELDVNEIARRIRMSRTKFYYKVKGLTGEPPSVFFRTYKLNRAAEMILEHKYTLSEISDMTGFSSLSHFSRSFKKQFGVAPTAYKA